MATGSGSHIYDLFCPSPAPLKQTASISVALEVWRTEIREYRQNNALSKLNLLSDPLSKFQLRNASPEVLDEVKKHVKKIGPSISEWAESHQGTGLSEQDLVSCFDDIVCDFDGTIDSVRTAQRLMRCDQIIIMVKFRIACVYCLVEDITRIWPDVMADVRPKYKYVNKMPELFYWICRLKNQLYKVPQLIYEDPLKVTFFNVFLYSESGQCPPNRSSLEYFLGCFDPETRMDQVMSLNFDGAHSKITYRYLLVELNDERLQELVDRKGDEIIFKLVLQGELATLAVWNHIKSKMKANVFNKLVRSMLGEALGYYSCPLKKDDKCFVEIWKAAPDHLKQGAVSDVIIDKPVTIIPHGSRLGLLVAMLSEHTSIEDRKTFWTNQWKEIVSKFDTKYVGDLMKLCFEDENQSNEFKATVLMNEREVIMARCLYLLQICDFHQLYAFSNHWNLNKEHMKETCTKLLDTGFQSNYESDFIHKASSLNQFIDYSYDGDNNLVDEFKGKLVLSEKTLGQLLNCLRQRLFWLVMNFVQIFAPSEEIERKVKETHLVPCVMECLKRNRFHVNRLYHLPIFMKWCLKTEMALDNFRMNLDAHATIQGIIREDVRSGGLLISANMDECSSLGCSIQMPHSSRYFLEDFLRWLLGSDEAFEQFRRSYQDDDLFQNLMRMSK